MYVLAIDTATNAGGVALSRNGEVLGALLSKSPGRYSETLLGMIDFLLSHHELTLRDIGLLAVAAGPGSFTGLRVGLATAKAFGQRFEIPSLGISTLEALAFAYSWSGRPVIPFMDARRRQVYTALYEGEGAGFTCRLPEQVSDPTSWLQSLPPRDYLLVGDAVAMYRQAIQAYQPQALSHACDNQILESLCRRAFWRFTQGEACPASLLKAHYLRPSDAVAAAGGPQEKP